MGYSGDMKADALRRDRNAMERRQAAARIYETHTQAVRDMDGDEGITRLRDLEDFHGDQRHDRHMHEALMLSGRAEYDSDLHRKRRSGPENRNYKDPTQEPEYSGESTESPVAPAEYKGDLSTEPDLHSEPNGNGNAQEGYGRHGGNWPPNGDPTDQLKERESPYETGDEAQ